MFPCVFWLSGYSPAFLFCLDQAQVRENVFQDTEASRNSLGFSFIFILILAEMSGFETKPVCVKKLKSCHL